MVSLSTSAAAAKPVVIKGNANGLWSPTHPHITNGQSTKPNSPVRYVPPTPPAPVEEPAIVSNTCPTLQSAPHLCQNS